MAKSLLAFIFIFSNAFAASAKSQAISVNPDQVIINPGERSVGKFLLNFKDYSDIRIDSDLDGKVDYWSIKKGNLQVTIRYVNGKVAYLKMKRITSSDVREALYIPTSNGKLKLVTAGKHRNLVMNGDADSSPSTDSPTQTCPLKKNSPETSLSDLAKTLHQQQVYENIESYFDDSCSSRMDVLEKPLADIILKEIFATSPESQESISSCIEDKQKPLDLGSEPTLSAQIISSNFKSEIAALSVGDKSFKNGIKCVEDENVDEPSATLEEGKGITLRFPKDPRKNRANLNDLFEHELLHRADIQDEATVRKIVQACPLKRETVKLTAVLSNNFSMQELPKNAENSLAKVAKSAKKVEVQKEADDALSKVSDDNTSTRSVAIAVNDAKNAVQGSAQSKIDLASEIATATPIPSAETLAQTNVQKTPEGISDAVNDSYAQGAPILRMANQVMGTVNTPALADTTTYEGSSYSSSSSNDSTSSTAPSRSVASTGTARIANITSRNTLKTDERVVEQVDLSNSNPSPAPTVATSTDSNSSSAAVGTTSARSNAAAVTKRANSVNRTPASGSGSGDLAAMNTANPSVGSFSSGAETDSSNPIAQSARTSNTGRRPASTASATGGGNSSSESSRDEVVTFFSNANYETSKGKLKDPAFVNNLKTNKVTIVDLYGNSYGADKGDVIFLDEGNRFVRQK